MICRLALAATPVSSDWPTWRYGRKAYRQLIANALGVTYEGAKPDDGQWDCDWTVKTSLDKDGWVAEMSIPFRSLGVKTPEPGEIWGMDLVRSFKGERITQLFCTHGANHRPEMFGQMVFSE